MESLSPLLCAAGDRFMQHPPCVQRVSCSSQEALPCFSGSFSFQLCRRAAGLTATVGLFVPVCLECNFINFFIYDIISVHVWWHVSVLLVGFFSALDFFFVFLLQLLIETLQMCF